MNPDPARRDAAALMAVAEALADLAEQHGHRELARFAHRAARRCRVSVIEPDPGALAVYR